MRVWIVGDSAIGEAARAYAQRHNAPVVDTSTPGATPEEVWTVQIHHELVRFQDAHAWPVTAVLSLPFTDYDSEATIHQLARRLPPNSTVLVVGSGFTPATLDGFTHEKSVTVRVVASLDNE